MSFRLPTHGSGLPGWLFAVLFGSIIGSWFNIPIAALHGGTTVEPTLVRVCGMLYVVPRPVPIGRKIVAINVGGAIIPTNLSSYLIVHDRLGWWSFVTVTFVALITHFVARVVPGVGIVVPTFVPPLAAALIARIAPAGEIRRFVRRFKGC
jgi:uncharacterized membrane protein